MSENDISSPGICSNCGEALDTETFLYCPACGALNLKKANEEGTVCDLHIENRAIGFCAVCGKAVCEECAENSGKKILCSDPTHREYLDAWTIVHRFDFEYEAAMLYANLEQKEIETQVFTKLNPDTTDAVQRPSIVEVWVPFKDDNAAAEILKLLGLDEEEENET
ncbi:MAG: B-box zinc finger protein [Candidatus Kryptoniota bacterium]